MTNFDRGSVLGKDSDILLNIFFKVATNDIACQTSPICDKLSQFSRNTRRLYLQLNAPARPTRFPAL